jgi:CRISPR/Cas system-associated exonuclease Cas4 (RecB family)
VDTAENNVAWARNRRVEISFGENANIKALHDEIKRIKLRTVKPKTCDGPNCK